MWRHYEKDVRDDNGHRGPIVSETFGQLSNKKTFRCAFICTLTPQNGIIPTLVLALVVFAKLTKTGMSNRFFRGVKECSATHQNYDDDIHRTSLEYPSGRTVMERFPCLVNSFQTRPKGVHCLRGVVVITAAARRLHIG